jgi:hypothetical protein
MRSGVATALVVCGTLLALMPSISDYFHGYQVSQFLADRTIQTGVTVIHQPFGEIFRASAWVLGISMIGLGAVSGGGLRLSTTKGEQRVDTSFGHDMLISSESLRREATAKLAS